MFNISQPYIRKTAMGVLPHFDIGFDLAVFNAYTFFVQSQIILLVHLRVNFNSNVIVEIFAIINNQKTHFRVSYRITVLLIIVAQTVNGGHAKRRQDIFFQPFYSKWHKAI